MMRFAITSRPLHPQAEWRLRLRDQAAALAAGGVEFLLVREKDLPAGELAVLCRDLLVAASASAATAGLASSAGARVLVSGRVDVAVACGLAGVHLGSGLRELDATQVRQVFRAGRRPDPWVSVSCHTLEEVRQACASGADSVLWGPVFGKTVQGVEVVPGTGLAELQLACEMAAPIPVFALGGVTLSRAGACVEAGAAGIAGIRMFA